jgi:hypothetical protein
VSLALRIDRFWRAPAPAARLATVRVLCGAFSVIYLVARAPVLADFRGLPSGRFEPVGLAFWLSGPLPHALVWLSWALCTAAGVAFTLGYRYRVSGPAFGALFLWVTSYRNSWGMIFHNDNLTVLHALVLGLSPAAAALSLDARREGARADDARYGWPLKLLCALTLATYLVAGLAKLRGAGLSFAEGDVLRNQIANDAMRKLQIGSIHSPFGAWLVQYAWPFPLLGSLSLAIELGAPLALFWPALARVWALSAWAFHFGVLLSMAIVFPYPLSGVAFAPLFEVERIWRRPRLAKLARWFDGS